MKRIQTMLSVAVSQAGKAVDHHHKHGAVIFEGNSVISAGHNRKKFTVALRKYGYKRCYLHAESSAILKTSPDYELNRAILLVVRVCKTKLGNSKPCEHCLAIIKERGIRTVVYSDVHGQLITMKI